MSKKATMIKGNELSKVYQEMSDKNLLVKLESLREESRNCLSQLDYLYRDQICLIKQELNKRNIEY